MKTLKELLIELDACSSAIQWVEDKTIEEAIKQCSRGDWIIWLSEKIDLPKNKIILAKVKCAKTIIHLMKDQRSIDVIDVAEKFGLGKCTIEELDNATNFAYAVYNNYINSATSATSTVYSEVYAARVAANISMHLTFFIESIAYAAGYGSVNNPDHFVPVDYNKGVKENSKQTAEILRESLGDLIINKVNDLLNN